MIGADRAALIKEVNQALQREPGSFYQTRARTEREAIARRYSYPKPSVQVQRARTFGRTQLGSSGIEEKLTELWTWAKKNWPYIATGTVLYAVLLAATLRRAK